MEMLFLANEFPLSNFGLSTDLFGEIDNIGRSRPLFRERRAFFVNILVL